MEPTIRDSRDGGDQHQPFQVHRTEENAPLRPDMQHAYRERVMPANPQGGSLEANAHTPVFAAELPAAESVAVISPVGPVALGDAANPLAVVQVLSPVGVEYVFMTISLFAVAGGLTAALLSLVNGKTDFTVLAFPTALLLISLPLFALLFLRTKRQELLRPALRQDPSKRRSTQFTQIVSFIISMFTLVGLVFSAFTKLGGQSSVPIGKAVLDGSVLLVVFGGMLAYYWWDEHRTR